MNQNSRHHICCDALISITGLSIGVWQLLSGSGSSWCHMPETNACYLWDRS